MSEQDWRIGLLDGASRLEVALSGRDPGAWPGYDPRPAVSAFRLADAVAAVWDFSVHGGSFGEDDATVLAAAASAAVAAGVPLLTLVRSGGTRLQEGTAALVGIPRARAALRGLAAAGLAHVSVADAPTTGGVWVGVTSVADLRVAVTGATVGFAGPRVVEAVTGALPGPGSHTADSAFAAGLVDARLDPPEVRPWLTRVLMALHSAPTAAPPAPAVDLPSRGGWEQVLAARARTTGGQALMHQLLTEVVPLRAPGGDETVAAALGRLSGRPLVAVAVAAQVGGHPTPSGYRLAARAYRLGGRLRLPVVCLVDTPGADPSPASEAGGIAAEMAESLDALLVCPSPTLALVHGEGGSGGALAAASTDTVLMTPDAYFAAIGPEGAAAALRRPAPECADLMRITPADQLALGFTDAVVDPSALTGYLDLLVEMSPSERLDRRWARWGGALPGGL